MQDSDSPQPATGCIAAIVPAAGSGRRFGQTRNKLFAELAGKPLWHHATAAIAARPEVGPIIMPIAAADREVFAGKYQHWIDELGIELVPGGKERSESVQAGLATIKDPSIGWVAVHDAARLLVTAPDLANVFATAMQSDAAILAAPISGTVKRDLNQMRRCETVDRRELWLALTPQVFRIELIRQAYAKHRGRAATDDAQLVERLGHDVSLVRGSSDNLKITHPEDLAVAEAILARRTHHG
ncbi:MAG: 2-C-methyl-D-erythritol 4-phosphate cytidylyltransferase [Pirellulales bacterium]|nr:2-C-methyl-D-erythritol 4-phosphate cytidylyltransferase [Pirellulales bacterium]